MTLRMTLRTTAAFAALLLATPALAQQRPAPAPTPRPAFSCIGAEELQDDVFEVPFGAGSDRLTDAARNGLATAIDLLKNEPDRNACILGHARREGGQQTSVQLAARRARSVNQALQRAGIPATRLRSEARVAGFSRTTGNAVARSVSIVIMPAAAPVPERGPRPTPAEPHVIPPTATPPAPEAPRTEPPRTEPPAVPAPPPATPAAPPAVRPTPEPQRVEPPPVPVPPPSPPAEAPRAPAPPAAPAITPPAPPAVVPAPLPPAQPEPRSVTPPADAPAALPPARPEPRPVTPAEPPPSAPMPADPRPADPADAPAEPGGTTRG
ncbi:OmpA family protein [Muricoccus radiodurans]|uniref:OmpA family protein n=1 Tax=Muricoccus radiodurans TaxID=2231721 RepID=UPI003CE7C862